MLVIVLRAITATFQTASPQSPAMTVSWRQEAAQLQSQNEAKHRAERKGFCEKLVGTQTCNFQRNHDVSTVINFAGAQLSDEPNIFIIV